MVKKVKSAQKAAEPAEESKRSVQSAEPEFKGVVSLGGTVNVTVGRNKSGKPWKKKSNRSEFSKTPAFSYQKRIEERERLKRIHEIETRLREERRTSKQEVRRRKKEKAERKKLNEFRSSTY